jgi:hypothetical protein
MMRANKRGIDESDENVHPPFKLPRLDVSALNKTATQVSAPDCSPNEKADNAGSEESVPEIMSDKSSVDEQPSDIPEILDIRPCLSHMDTPTLLATRFRSIAGLLLNDYHLCISKTPNNGATGDEVIRFELLEVEFYLRAPDHMDPFAHGTEEQRNAGRW